eukprot:c11433_g1_i2.p1 GENE.c11433_g1_i2~~c11433_g1_i2.p1  ORF type:complete len:219 (+),score=40.08 c11433_g1_i2:50-706(+)
MMLRSAFRLSQRLHSPASPHEVLGVNYGASQVEIKTAFRKKVLEWHPDQHQDKDVKLATRKFQEISAAYKALLGGHNSSNPYSSDSSYRPYAAYGSQAYQSQAGYDPWERHFYTGETTQSQKRAHTLIGRIWILIISTTALIYASSKWEHHKYKKKGIKLVDCFYNPVTARYERATEEIRKSPTIFIQQQPAYLVFEPGSKKPTQFRPAGAAQVRNSK